MIRKIPNFNQYTIDTDGNIYNEKSKKFIAHINRSGGYYCVWMYNDTGIRKNMLLHRVLMLTFFPENPNNYPCIDHLDRNKKNNKLSNLRYASYSQNSLNRGKSYNNSLGKNIVKYVNRFRVVISKEGNRIYDRSFNKKHYTLEMVKCIRNKILLENNLNIFD
jgi:hypothetical protein